MVRAIKVKTKRMDTRSVLAYGLGLPAPCSACSLVSDHYMSKSECLVDIVFDASLVEIDLVN